MSDRKIKDYPCRERPYEKCMEQGAKHLSDSELLAVILRSGCHGESVVEMALVLLKLCEDKGGIHTLHQISFEELKKIRGIGSVKAIQIACIVEFSKRLWRSEQCFKLQVDRPVTVADYYMEMLRHSEVEETWLVFMDGKNHFLCDYQLSMGTVNCSLVSTREIFKMALRKQAVYILLIHNHPSGDPSPSKEDILVTKKVIDAGKLMEIPLIDHIIIGDGKYISLKEKGFI